MYISKYIELCIVRFYVIYRDIPRVSYFACSHYSKIIIPYKIIHEKKCILNE